MDENNDYLTYVLHRLHPKNMFVLCVGMGSAKYAMKISGIVWQIMKIFEKFHVGKLCRYLD